jgi:hypothetical protein
MQLSAEKKLNKSKNSFINLFLKPNKNDEKYRFRLLFYRQPSKNDRKDPFIYQKLHDHWGTTSSGKKIVDDVIICPGTDYVHYDEKKFIVNEKTGKNELNCPICKKARENMQAWMNSGKTDKLSMMKFNQLKQKERLCIPVYVIHDPNTYKVEDGETIYMNDGKFKVLILTNKDDIKKFTEVVDEEKTKAYIASKNGNPYEVFNGNNAVDLYIQYGSIPEIKNAGTDKEYTTETKKIINIAFGKKASQIDVINKDAIDKFEFDDQFYFSNTKEELISFYKKYYGNNDVTPEEDDVFESVNKIDIKKETVVETINPQISKQSNNSDIDEQLDEQIDDLIDDENGENITENNITTSDEKMDEELDSILNEII